VIQGGSWDEDADRLRCAARRGSDDDDWRRRSRISRKARGGSASPLSASAFGRFVRSASRRRWPGNKFWDADIDQIREDVENRINQEGRGSRGCEQGPARSDPLLPK
jgi:hypothetical protein